MEKVDVRYLCTTIGSLSGIPIRIFEGETQVFFYAMVYLPKDPMALWRKEIFAIADHVGYYVTPQFHYYGVVNAGDTKLVVGPTQQIGENERELRELAFRLNLSGEEAEALIAGGKRVANAVRHELRTQWRKIGIEGHQHLRARTG